MRSMTRLLSVALTLLLCMPAMAAEWRDSQEAANVFAKNGVIGTFVVYDVEHGVFTGYNRLRAEERFIPASTFKIPNTLIGLASGAVKSVDEVLPYGGKPQPRKEWEKDMSLREAITVSNVPVFQELARRVGVKPYEEMLDAMEYGNASPGTVADTFWLKGPLTISAMEQARFMAALAKGSLPAPAEAQAATREITLLAKEANWELHGKTGTADAEDPNIGWWVGWVQKDGKIYAFALNIDMPTPNAPNRVELGKACLHALGIL